MRLALRWAFRGLVLLWSLALLAWLTLHWGILPRVDQWRPQLEQAASRALGMPLRIGQLRAHSEGWVPAVEVSDLRVLDRQGREALHLPRVVAALSPRSLLLLELRLSQLLVDGPSLDVRRDRAGRVHVAGLDLASLGDRAAAATDPALLDWVLRQEELVVRRGRVRWTDELRGAAPLTLLGVDAVLRNGARRHELRLDASPPPDWGERFSVRGRFERPILAEARPWWQRDGEVYVELPLADLSQLRHHVGLPVQLDEGRGAVRAWVRLEQGRPVRTTADVALNAVTLRLAQTLPPLVLRALSGRVEWGDEPRRWWLATEGLGFETDDDVGWAPSSMRLQLDRNGRQQPFDGGALRADRLDLATMARIAGRLPLPAGWHALLRELRPEGRLAELAGTWTGAADAPSRYEFKGRALGLALAPGRPGAPDAHGHRAAGRPGLRGAELDFHAHQAGGSARLSLRDGGLSFPGVFDEPELALARVDARLAWSVTPRPGAPGPEVELRVEDLGFANADAQGSLNARWRTGAGEGVGAGGRYPGQLALSGRIERGRAAAVVRYLPTAIPVSARSYVAAAVRGGEVRDGRFDVEGDLWHFPFVGRRQGVFRIATQVRDIDLAYVPPDPGQAAPAWPPMQVHSGELVFERASMTIRGARASVGALRLQQVQGGIADLVDEGVLRLDGKLRGAATDMLGYVAASPVGGWLDGALAQASASGDADLALALVVPVQAPQRATVRGTLQLAGNTLRLRPEAPVLDQVRARVEFSERGLSIVDGRARALGGELRLDASQAADGQLRLRAQGQARARELFAPTALPALAPLAPWAARIDGQAAYRLQLGFGPAGAFALDLDSTLAGVALDLPAPLAKPAAAAWPLRVQASSLAASPSLTRWSVDLGEALRLRAVADGRSGAAEPWRARAALGAQALLPALPERGLALALRLPELDADAWRRWSDRPGSPAVAVAGPLSASLEIGRLRLAGRDFDRLAGSVRLGAGAPGATAVPWRAELRADQGEGQLAWAPGSGPRPARWQVRFDRLDVPAPPDPGATGAPPAGPGPLATAPTTPATPATVAALPELDLAIGALRWHGREFGRVELRAAPAAGPAAQWRLDRLQVHAADATLLASGQWREGEGMRMALTLALADAGHFAQRLGAGNALRDGRGSLEGSLRWRQATLLPALGELDGTLTLALEDGRFMKAEPGAARLLGVLSLQALPRRLLLDFRDLFQEGFRFDKVSGRIDIERGVARTDNLRIVGVQAAVLIDGWADLPRETQDLRVVVVPEVNAGAASLAFAAVNPALALGSLLAQWVLREPILAASTREFRITGAWTEPRVERIGRDAADPGAGEPAAAPAPAAGPRRERGSGAAGPPASSPGPAARADVGPHAAPAAGDSTASGPAPAAPSPAPSPAPLPAPAPAPLALPGGPASSATGIAPAQALVPLPAPPAPPPAALPAAAPSAAAPSVAAPSASASAAARPSAAAPPPVQASSPSPSSRPAP